MDKKNISDVVALTSMQEGLLFHYLKDPQSDVYFEQLSLGISAPVDIEYFQQAWNVVVKINDMMRTVFRWEKIKIPSQIVLKEHKIEFRYYDLSGGDENEAKKQLERIKIKDRREKFDLREVPFRVTLCKLEDETFEAIISNHHILYDGWSNGIILKEFIEAYDKLIRGEPLVPLPPVKTKFREFVRWIQTRDTGKEAEFWKDYLGGLESGTEIQLHKAAGLGPGETGHGFGTYRARIPRDRKTQLEMFAGKMNVTFASLLYSAWGVLLQKYNNTYDVVMGTTVSGRSAKIKGIEDIVGLFINTLPLRVQSHPQEKIENFLKRTDQALKMREEFESASLVNIKEYSGISSEKELFDTVLAVENYPLDARLIQTQKSSPLSLCIDSYSLEELTHYNLTITITYFENSGLDICWIYDKNLFDEDIIVRLSNHFDNILAGIETNASGGIHEIEILSPEEKHELLVDFNDTAFDYPCDKAIPGLFAEQAARTPDSVAVKGPLELPELPEFDRKKSQVHITFRELDKRCDQVAYALKEKGVLPGDIIGIILERSIEMILGILGILKAGGAYLPIDPEAPGERIDYMVRDSNARILVSEVSKVSKVSEGTEIVSLSELSDEFPTHLTHPTHPTHPTHLCYIIYTSGSTGRPKGVPITHANFSPLIHWGYDCLGIGVGDRVLQNLSYYFDWSVWEIFITLTTGACLYMVSREVIMDPELCIDFIRTHGLTVLHITPTHYSYLVNTGKSLETLRYLFIGAEKLTYDLVKRSIELVGPGCRVFNMYGPTEVTIISTALEIDRARVEDYKELGSVPIGRASGNLFLLVLDKYLELCPVRVAGELYIAGDGVAPGYLNNPELTAEKFVLVHSSWLIADRREKKDGSSEKLPMSYELSAMSYLYKTGDLARWLPEGNIEFIGRIDHQVKIRGFRIETGEIENQLLNHAEIKEAVVLTREDRQGAQRYLCAYFVSDHELSNTRLREYLSKRLPGYMIPSYFVRVENIPLTPNGKVDRKALPEPDAVSGKEYAAPRDEEEQELVEIWSDVLGLEKEIIGIDDNFFELGGHSLKATRLMGRIHKAFDIEVPLSQLFQRPTVRDIRQYIREAQERRHRSIERIEKKEYYPLSPAQKRFYIFQQLEPDNLSYNMNEIMVVEGRLQRERFETVFKQLIERQESLRTGFCLVDGEPIQRVCDSVEFGIKTHDAAKGKSTRLEIEEIIDHFIRPFDLSRAPLMRVELIHTPPFGHPSQEGIPGDKYILMVDMHHIIGDGVSIEIFVKEFLAIYYDEKLPLLRVQYKDYVRWMTGKRERAAKDQGKETGKTVFEGDVLNLPLDYSRPPVQHFQGNIIRFEAGEGEKDALISLALQQDTTLYMVLLSVFYVFLAKLSGQESIVVGSPVAGRLHYDLEGVIGLFINTVVLRDSPSGAKGFSEFLAEVKVNALDAFENQEYQYEELTDRIQAARESGRNPLFDVMFVLQNMEWPEITIQGLTIRREVGEYLTSKFDMTLYCEERQNLVYKLEYCTCLFKEETIRRFIKYFRKVIFAVLENPQRKISSIEIITGEEKEQILYEFNDTAVPYSLHKTIYQVLAEQAERTPGNIAVIEAGPSVEEHSALTYRELNEKANRLARLLRTRGVDKGAIIGLMLERSLEMVVGIQGILRAGGAYLPIDSEYPDNRILAMLEGSGASMVLTDTGVVEKKSLPSLTRDRDIHLLMVDELTDELEHQGSENLEPVSGPGDLIYIIFTSGSTGKPKGAGVYHRGFMNLMNWFVTDFGLGAQDSNLVLTSLSFDLTQKNFYASLMKGGMICLPGLNYFEPRTILREIRDYKVSWINCTPSMFYKLVEYDESEAGENKKLTALRYVFLGGEPISMTGLLDWLESPGCHARIVNTYGPTECTDICASFRVEEPRRHLKEVIPVGSPVYNARLYVVSKDMQLQPVGVPGELVIGGDGVGIGYVNDRELTTRKFILHSFEARGQKQLLYQTGDLVKWLPEGDVEFISRVDFQVKVRGFRIELGEIENRLASHANVKENLVMAREGDGGENYLCAYIVLHDENAYREMELRDYLSAELPDYMVPAYFVVLEKMPLNPNGKVDRKALPEPDITDSPGRGYVPPANEMEKVLVDIWADVLGMERRRIGVRDNFFQLGGHSLKAAGLVGRIHKAFSVEIPIAELFKTPTVKGIYDFIHKTRESIYRSIKQVEEKEYYLLSPAQKRLYVVYRLDENSTGYNIPYAVELKGDLDFSRLEDTFKKSIEQHESLRTSFEMVDDEPVQRIKEDVEFDIECYDELTSFGIHQFVRPFDLSHSSLLRVGLKKLELKKYIMMVDMHHIISDGMSMDILIREFSALYGDADVGKGPGVLRLQYKDYAEWQNSDKVREAVSGQGAYWQKEFADEIPVLDLPKDFARPAMQSYEGEMVKFEISSEHMEKLREYVLEEGATLFMLLLSLYNVLLFKLSGQEDIVIGTPAAGRRHIDLSRIIGIFINTLALRNFPVGEKTFRQFLDDVKERALAAFENQDYPFEDLVDQVEVQRDTSRNPLFDVMLVLQNMEMQELQIPGLELKEYIFEDRKSKFDMTLTVLEKDQALDFILTYSSDLFTRKTIERFIGYFKRIVLDILENPHKKIAEIEILSSEEKRQLVIDFNDTSRAYPEEKTIYQLFAEQAAGTPEKIAVVGSSQLAVGKGKRTGEPVQLSYRELNRKSNQLARMLRSKGADADMVVGIMTQPSLEMVIGIMATLKAGGTYLPIDPKHPVERIKYMIDDSRAKLVLTQTALIDRITCDVEIIRIDDSNIFKGEDANLESISGPSNLLYTIYTSGSTGKPKGVLLKHENLVNYVSWFTREAGLIGKDRTILTSSFGFDLGYTSIYSSILRGCELHILPEEIYLSPERLIDYMVRHEISYIKMTPSLFNTVVESSRFSGEISRTLRLVVLGGEAIKVSDVAKVFQTCDNIAIMNHYGPTESTIGSVAQFIDKNRMEEYTIQPTIGQPIYNTQVYIIDKHLELLPVGVAGELCIGGDGLARGYLNHPELTAETFLSISYKSYRSYRTYISKKIYKTGDLARWLLDGNIEFIGRIDHQVKIRGFRLELGEIANQLLRIDGIKEAVVIADRREPGDLYLCAYFVPGNNKALDLKEALSRELPDYAIPSYFVRIDKIPLTPNGKLDRRALPKPQAVETGEEYAAPANRAELKMAELWSDLLDIEKIGMKDNFFSLGGHSLKAIILISRIHKAFNVSVTLAEIFKQPTIRGLSQYIKDREADPFAAIKFVEEKDYYILSSAQKRLYLLHQMDENSTNYNMPYGIVLEGKVDKRRLEDTFIKLINRHESLRTSFEEIDDEPVQRIHQDVEFEIKLYSATEAVGDRSPKAEITEARRQKTKNIAQDQELPTANCQLPTISNFIRPFDLTRPPLLRVGLAQLEENKRLLMIDMHHIISDGISRRVLINEFTAFYAGEELPALKIQYNDFAEWQTSEKKREALADQEAYWKEQFRDEVPVLELPTDYPRPAVQSFEGSSVMFEIDSEKLEVLKSLALERGTTLYMVLLALYNILLSKLSNQEDILIGTPTAGRGHADLEQIIGMFVNTLVLRNFPAGEKTYTAFLNEIKERSLAAFDNQDFQYEDLVEEVVVTRDASRNPLFDTMFVLQNTGMPEIEISGLRLTPFEHEAETSKFDLLLSGLEVEEKLLLTFEYSTKLFKKTTIVRFIKYLESIVFTIIENPAVKINEIGILTEEERNQLLYGFNETETGYPGERTIHELFADQVEQTPDSAAVIGMGHAITYRELNEKSDQLAYGLRCKGVGPDSIVGLMVDRSIEMITGIMGILKAGGAYLPIELGYPQERIDYMLADSGAKILVSELSVVSKVSGGIEVIKPGELSGELPTHLTHLTHFTHPTQLCYVIYTSGTTGRPKGVLTSHYNVTRVVRDTNYIDIEPGDRILQLSNYAFDGSVFDIYGALLNGSALVLIEKDDVLAVERLADIIKREAITVFFVTTALFNTLVDLDIECLHGIRKVLFGGERVSIEHSRNALAYLGKDRVIHVYGPTETTVYATYYFIDGIAEGAGTIPIGKPISNTTAYILDSYLQPVPIGVSGELYIGGTGTARGYLNSPELTTEKFVLVHSSWLIADRREKKDGSSEKLPMSYELSAMSYLYKTGDLARWLPEGNIEFIGRIDHQVKIRGFRIELGEIESQLLTHDEIKEVVVISKEDQQGSHRGLCAYFVSDSEISTAQLREYLSKNLPDYMVPSYFIRLDRIPLTPNGKVDRRALPEPGFTAGENYVAPRDKIEKELVRIWSRVLSNDALHASQLQESIGIDDNFFELGGHSLKAARLMSRIYSLLNVKVPLTEIFRAPSIRGLAGYISETIGDRYVSIEPVEKREYYLLSPAQKRLCVLQQTNIHDMNYNMPQVMELEGELVKGRLEDTFKKLIERHESFRTSFETHKGELVQRVHEYVEFEVERLAAAADKDNIADIIHSFVQPFDLSQPPLLRVGLIKVDKGRHILTIDMHHIITDGSSMGIFVREFMALQTDEALPPLRTRYKDFSAWMNSKSMKESIKKQEQYWLKEFAGEVPLLRLYTDEGDLYRHSQSSSPEQWSLEGKRMSFELDSTAAGGLKELAKEEGMTLYMVLMAIYNILLFKLSGQEDIVVGTVTAGRSHPDLQPVIGMFVNTLALRNYPRREATFSEFLKEVKAGTLEAFENQAYPFEELAEKVTADRDSRRNPLFDVMFILQNLDIPEVQIPGLTLRPYTYENVESKFDLSLFGFEEDNKLVFSFEYRTARFNEGIISEFVGYFKDIIAAVLENKEIKLVDIELSSDFSDSRLETDVFQEFSGDFGF